VVVFDSREGRVLSGRKRKIVDDREWEWIEEQVRGDFDHLLLVDTLPVLLSPALLHLEAWSEAVCAGAWGRRLTAVGERIRRGLDLEHWAAFGDSFERMTKLLAAVGAGKRGEAPATIVMVGGDVHHAYLAEVAFRQRTGVRSAVYQAVCSPFRNALDWHERAVVEAATHEQVEVAFRTLARAAGVTAPEIRWRLVQDPTFDNQFATLTFEGRKARLRIEKIVPGDWRNPDIDITLEKTLAYS
jgi:hypothetical protein